MWRAVSNALKKQGFIRPPATNCRMLEQKGDELSQAEEIGCRTGL